MKFNEETIKIVVNAGKIGISPETLAYQLGVDEKALKKELSHPQSELSKLFRIGQELHMVDIFVAMNNKALEGDTEAANMVIKLHKEIDYQRTARRLFGD